MGALQERHPRTLLTRLMPSPTQTSGRHGEDLAHDYLLSQGLSSLKRNYRCRRGEIDLVMQEGQTIVFIEVRMRRSTRFGSAEESIDWRKQQKIIATALHFLHARRLDYSPVRFDVLTLRGGEGRAQIRWIRNAFSA